MLRNLIGAAATALAVGLSGFTLSHAYAEDIPAAEAPEAAPTPDAATPEAPVVMEPPIIVTAAALPPGTRQVATSYEGSWNGFATLDIAVAATITPRAYAVVANLIPEGLTELTSHLRKSTTYQARVSGQLEQAGDPKPVYYFHHGGAKDREVEVKFSPQAVTTIARPRFGDYGDPPASSSQRLEATDTLTALVSMVSANPDTVCNRTLKIFDGKARYDIALSPAGTQKIHTRGYKGKATKCQARYTRIAGYDRPKKGEKPLVEKPFTIWFAPAANGLQIPARIKVDSNFGPISINLEYMEATAIS